MKFFKFLVLFIIMVTSPFTWWFFLNSAYGDGNKRWSKVLDWTVEN